MFEFVKIIANVALTVKLILEDIDPLAFHKKASQASIPSFLWA